MGGRRGLSTCISNNWLKCLPTPEKKRLALQMTWFLLAEQERGKTLPPTSSAELGHSFRTSQCNLDTSLWISRGCLCNFLPRLRSACLFLVVLWDPCPVLISWNWHTVILQYAGIFAQREVYCVSMPTNSKKQPIFLPSLFSFLPSLLSF